MFSSYPDGKWRPLSAHPVFYEKILAKLTKKRSSADSSKASTKKSHSAQDSVSEDPIEPTRIVAPKEKPSSSAKKKKIKIKLSREFKEEVLAEERADDIIEMEELDKKIFSALKSLLKAPILVAVALAVVLIVFTQGKNSSGEERVRLMFVKEKRQALSPQEFAVKLRRGLLFYFKGTVSNYLNAQRQYIQILEGSPEKKEIYIYLCAVYLELWPFAYQDTKDRGILNTAVNSISKIDPEDMYSGMCKSAQAFINSKPANALIIAGHSAKKTTNPIHKALFYYVKAKALKEMNQTDSAKNQLENVFRIFSHKKWAPPHMLKAQIFYEERRYELAAKEYQKVLSSFPNHISARLRLGILEYKYFKKFQNSEARLRPVLNSLNDFVQPDILLEAYVALAGIYLKQNNKKGAVEYLNKAYGLDPEHPDVILLKSKLGETEAFKDVEIQARGVIYKGDLLASQGDCPSAVKYFQKAYRAGSKTNGLAAMKAGQCYWQSGASGQAVRWLKRAINADDQMLSAYFLLADYLSDLYDFENAKDILKAVKSQKPSKYDLSKAYAKLSFRQKQYSAAVSYAEQSLQFYTSDVEVYILLSKAYSEMKNYRKAFFYAAKAIEEDLSSVPAQIVYSLAQGPAEGWRKTEERFGELIKNFPAVMEYRQAFGEYYFREREYDKASSLFQGIMERNPKFKKAYLYMGRIYNEQSLKSGGLLGEKYERALKYFVEASLLDISDPEPIFYLAQAYMRHQQYQLAENEFEKILQITPHYPLIHYYIGLVNFHQQGEKGLEKALKFAKTQAAKTPKHYLPYKLAGDVYKLKAEGAFRTDQDRRIAHELCAKEYQKALKYLKNNIEISIKLIGCYKGAGLMDSALQFAIQLSEEEGLSGYPALYKEIGDILESKDQYDRARVYYNHYFTLKPGAKDRAEINTRINKRLNEKRELSQSKEK